MDTIYPCTTKHISKHEAQSTEIRQETPNIYRAFVVPYIKSIPESHIQWVYNILEGKKEADRVILEDRADDTGFTLLPDLKWDQVPGHTMPRLINLVFSLRSAGVFFPVILIWCRVVAC